MKYTWGDTVVYTLTDENGKIVKKPVAVVGLTPIETEKESAYFKAPIGSAFYTIEFGDGSSKLVSENELESYKAL